IKLKNDEIRNSKAYKEYYAIAIGEAAPKPKASVRRTRSSSDTSITPPTAAASPRLTTFAKGKQTTKASKAKSLSALSEDDDGDEADEGDDGKEGNGDDDDDDEDDDGEKGDDDDANQEVGRDDDKDDDEEGGDDEHESDEETREEESFDPISQTPKDSEDEGNSEEDLSLNIGDEERHDEEEEEDELYRDQEISSVSSQFVTSMLNLTLDIGMKSIFKTTSRMDVPTPTSVAPLPITTPTMTSSTIATTTTTSQAPILPTTVPSDIIQHLPSFGSLFRFDDRLRIVNHYMDQRMNEAVRVVVQIQSDRLRDKTQRENDEFLRTVNENINKIIKEQVKEQVKAQDEEPSTGPDRGSKRRREGKEPESASAPMETATRSAGRSEQGSRSRQALASESALADEPMQTTSQMEEPSHLEFDTGTDDQPIVPSSQHPEWFSQQQKPLTPDHAWNKTLSAVHGSIQPWISKLAKQADTRSSFNELIDTPLNFSNFLMIRLRVDTLTPELLVVPT
nr:hypothetical protein [Tanacetum cinerariifolium]